MSEHPVPNLIRLGGVERPPFLDDGQMEHVRRHLDPPFHDAEYRDRVDRVRGRISELGLDAIFVFRPSSVEWLCGYHSIEPLPQPLLVTPDWIGLCVPDPEVGRALASSVHVDIVHYSSTEDALALIVDEARRRCGAGARFGIETQAATTPPRAIELLAASGPGATDTDFLVERERLTLSPAERGQVERAARITARGFDAALKAAHADDATDSQIAAALCAALYGEADSPAPWGPVVATGWRGGVAHSTWAGERLAAGRTTFLEYAGASNRYVAPSMRTLVRGRPSPLALRLEAFAQTMVAAVLDALRPGVEAGDVARAAEKALGPLPDNVAFHFNFGYPAGLAHPPHWMDGAPFYLVRDNTEPVTEGMAFHVPASFRAFGEEGVGLSHTVVVEPDGARPVTSGELRLEVIS